MANILYYPQLSMYDKTTKELIPAADGNVNMMRNTILEWKKYRPDDLFIIILPSELNDKEKLKHILPDGTKNAVPIFYNQYVISARINRYNFPMNEIISKIEFINKKIDLIINDVIEVTPNFKQMFKVQFGYEPKIISNIRHTDEADKSDYIYGVIDGFWKSDITTILSESMKPKLKKQLINADINRNMVSYIIKHIHVFEPSVSHEAICNFKAEKYNNDKVIITFPGRLSPGEENRTNYDKFIEAIIKLRDMREDFEVYFTDPNNSMTEELKESLKDWVHTIPKDRNEFLTLLHNTDIIVSLMNVEGFGGISIREALLAGCRPVIPYIDEYRKMAYDGYEGFTRGKIDVEDLTYRLNWSVDRGKSKGKQREFWKNQGMQFSVEEQFKNLYPKIEVLLNGIK